MGRSTVFGCAVLLFGFAGCEGIDTAEEQATMDPRDVQDAHEALTERQAAGSAGGSAAGSQGNGASAGAIRSGSGADTPREPGDTSDDPTAAAGTRTGRELWEPGDQASTAAGEALGSEQDTDVTDEGEETDVGGRGEAGRRGGDAAGDGADFG